MRLFLDTEFNGFGGALMSLALFNPNGPSFYEVVEAGEPLHPWVAENVLPKLGKAPILMAMFKSELVDFLYSEIEEIEIIADAPADFVYFMRALEEVTPDGNYWHLRRSLTLRYLPELNSLPKNPHNALSDAEALAQAYEAEGASDGQ